MTYILYNPKANNNHGTEGLDQVTAALKASGGGEPRMLDLTALDAKTFLMGLPAGDEVILCGGDGTLHHLINDLDGAVPAVPVKVWRMGTGNDFLRDVLGESGEQTALLNDYIGNLPSVEVPGGRRRFLNNVSLGLDGQVCELGEQEKARLGRPVNYIALALRLIFRDYHAANATVTVDGESRSYERVWVASVFNGRYVGGGQMLAPRQDRTGDELCCVVLHGLGRLTALVKLPKVLRGAHEGIPQCDVRFGRDISVTLDRPGAINLDGEPLERVTGYRAVK